MYGTIFRMMVNPGQEQELVKVFEEWDRDFKPKVKGARGGFLLKTDANPQEMYGVAVFQDRESYMANADNPEQDRWYQRVRACLQEDPQWMDGEYIAGTFS